MSVITYTVNGTVSAVSGFYPAIDGSGLFGPRGTSILGDHFWVTWIGTPCNCTGVNDPHSSLIADGYSYPSPILDVTLSIGNQPYGHNPTYDFGGNETYGEFYFYPPFHGLNIQQAGYFIGGASFISTSFGFSGNPDAWNGAFQIVGGTSGGFTDMAVGVPAPELGSGWTSLLIVALLWVCFWHRRAMRQCYVMFFASVA